MDPNLQARSIQKAPLPNVLEGQTTDSRSRPQLVLELIRRALDAPDLPAAIMPALDALVARTTADGSAYFQVGERALKARSVSGMMPEAHDMDSNFQSLPAASLVRALELATEPLFFDDAQSAQEAEDFFEMGVASLAAAPVKSRLGELLGVFLMYTPVYHRWNKRERELFSAVTESVASVAARRVAEEQALLAKEDAIKALGIAVEGRDAEVEGHTDRVANLAVQVGQSLGLDDTELNGLRWGAYLHDLGKVATPDVILHKPGRLDDNEWKLMRQHVDAGYQVARRLNFLPQSTLDTIRYHHERWDGQGYPYGLDGEAIPLTARIFSVCDVYDALVSPRPYKLAWLHEEALSEIVSQKALQFDPVVIDAFLGLFPDFVPPATSEGVSMDDILLDAELGL